MEILVLFLLSSAIVVQGYGKSDDPNDEPFLPIYPVYPYSPKLIKRGAERESGAQLSPELYAPKVDAKDSYSTSFGANYPRDLYYTNYNPYPKGSSPSSYTYSSLPYTYPTAAYGDYNSYSNPYAIPPPSYSAVPYSASYPNYYYQPPYYYPNYYAQPLFPPPPLPPPDYSNEAYSDPGDKTKKKPDDSRYRGDVDQDSSGNQYVDGGNYISGNGKDLDPQPSTYKTNNPRNQMDQVSELPVKNIQIPVPKTSYRVISVAGQPVGPDYPLPAPYLKAQQLEEIMSQTWAKMMSRNVQQQAGQYLANEVGKGSVTNDARYQNDQNGDPPRYISVPNVIAKTGLAYIVNPNSILGKLTAAGQVIQTSVNQPRNTKYSTVNPGVYAAVEKPLKEQTDAEEYETYENQRSQAGQEYDSALNQADKRPQTFGNDHVQSYPSQNFVTAQTPRAYSYRYSAYNPPQTSTQQQSQLYKAELDDVNFGSKTKKGFSCLFVTNVTGAASGRISEKYYNPGSLRGRARYRTSLE
ncbi:uncharacterized protein LOC143149697 [Ptiloglossa arizonensis]|uniref:uncharacterized protein LOC143149697 n=1 Tax=Ptiloglossa arizonensis TaxID=3350558 RepID=UPI003F9FC593